MENKEWKDLDPRPEGIVKWPKDISVVGKYIFRKQCMITKEWMIIYPGWIVEMLGIMDEAIFKDVKYQYKENISDGQ